MNTPHQNLHEWQIRNQQEPLLRRAGNFYRFLQGFASSGQSLYRREVLSAADREVLVQDPLTSSVRPMLMFASNNYLGLANHPYIREKVRQAAQAYGTGIGGPPLLNGFLRLTGELEERLAALKGQEAALLFSSGYAANLGLLGALVRRKDLLCYDEFSHASFLDGIHLGHLAAREFPHNRLDRLEALLENTKGDGDKFVGVEGIYSMDGDMAPLNELAALCRRYNALLIVDDAHGTGVVGKRRCRNRLLPELRGRSGHRDGNLQQNFCRRRRLCCGFPRCSGIYALSLQVLHFLRLPATNCTGGSTGRDRSHGKRTGTPGNAARKCALCQPPAGTLWDDPRTCRGHHRIESAGGHGYPYGQPGIPQSGYFPECD
jgi:hypothetical protein